MKFNDKIYNIAILNKLYILRLTCVLPRSPISVLHADRSLGPLLLMVHDGGGDRSSAPSFFFYSSSSSWAINHRRNGGP